MVNPDVSLHPFPSVITSMISYIPSGMVALLKKGIGEVLVLLGISAGGSWIIIRNGLIAGFILFQKYE